MLKEYTGLSLPVIEFQRTQTMIIQPVIRHPSRDLEAKAKATETPLLLVSYWLVPSLFGGAQERIDQAKMDWTC